MWVVGYQYQFVLARGIGQCGYIEHFEQQGSGRLDVQDAGVGPSLRFQFGHDGAGVGHVDIHARQHGLVQIAHGSVSARSEEHTSELQSLMRISYAVFCLKKKKELIDKPEHGYYTTHKQSNNK